MRYASVCSGVEAEVWRDIAGYEGVYQVSSLGRICRLHYKRGKVYFVRILKPRHGNIPYLTIHLCFNSVHKRFTIHRLVAQAFISNPNNYPQVNHKDENHKNNCVENLEWCSEKYNHNYGTAKQRGHEKLSKKVIYQGVEYASIRECHRQTGKCRKSLRKCVI